MESAQHPQAAAMVGPEKRLTVSLLLLWTFAVAVVLVRGWGCGMPRWSPAFRRFWKSVDGKPRAAQRRDSSE